MNVARGQPPRNVPTLTEVVQRPEAHAHAPAAPYSGPDPDRAERLARDVLRRIEPDLEARLREVIAGWVLEQSQVLVPQLRGEIEGIVRRAVMEALQEGRTGH